jgi:hypothetical protein
VKQLALTAPFSEPTIANAFDLAARVKSRRNHSRRWSFSLTSNGFKSFRATITRKL